MARVTVENCLEKVGSRFELVVVAAERAKDLNYGAHSNISSNKKEKDAIVALREIAADEIDIDKIRDSLINKTTKNNRKFLKTPQNKEIEENLLSEQEAEEQAHSTESVDISSMIYQDEVIEEEK